MGLLDHTFAPFIHLSRHVDGAEADQTHDEVWQKGAYNLVHCREGVVHVQPRSGDKVTIHAGQSGLAEPGSVIRMGYAASATWLTCTFVMLAQGSIPVQTQRLAGRYPQPGWQALTDCPYDPLIHPQYQARSGDMIDRLAKRYCHGDMAQLEANWELGDWLLGYMRLLDDLARQGHEREQSFVSTVDRLIKERLREGVRVSDLARICGMSASQLRKRYQHEAGSSPGDAIEAEQWRTAQTLLRHDHLAVAEVALRSGFRNASAFSRWFRSRCGCTPREWRVRQRV